MKFSVWAVHLTKVADIHSTESISLSAPEWYRSINKTGLISIIVCAQLIKDATDEVTRGKMENAKHRTQL